MAGHTAIVTDANHGIGAAGRTSSSNVGLSLSIRQQVNYAEACGSPKPTCGMSGTRLRLHGPGRADPSTCSLSGMPGRRHYVLRSR